MMYTQVPQDGAFIRLSAGDTFYNYHYGGRRGLFLCEQEENRARRRPSMNCSFPAGAAKTYSSVFRQHVSHTT